MSSDTNLGGIWGQVISKMTAQHHEAIKGLARRLGRSEFVASKPIQNLRTATFQESARSCWSKLAAVKV
jgi:hypothetical protein